MPPRRLHSCLVCGTMPTASLTASHTAFHRGSLVEACAVLDDVLRLGVSPSPSPPASAAALREDVSITSLLEELGLGTVRLGTVAPLRNGFVTVTLRLRGCD